MSHQPKGRYIGTYLRGVRSHFRTQIMRLFRDSLEPCDRRGSQGVGFKCNAKTREKLADAIFRVEDELESRCGGQPDHPVVVQMRKARHRVNVDLGWDEDVERDHPVPKTPPEPVAAAMPPARLQGGISCNCRPTVTAPVIPHGGSRGGGFGRLARPVGGTGERPHGA